MTETETEAPAACARCKKDIAKASPCNRCGVQYCSTGCVNLHWKKHKKECTPKKIEKPRGSSSFAPYVPWEKLPDGLKKPVDAKLGWRRLSEGTWFHKRPESDVYKLLIDAYRLRMNETWCLAKEEGEPGLEGFHAFLIKAAAVRSNKGYRLLPDWWTKEKRRECEELATDLRQWTCLWDETDKWDIHDHYGDMGLAMQLRSLADTITGRRADGSSTSKIPEGLCEPDPELDYYRAYDDSDDSDDTESLAHDHDDDDLRS